MIVAHLTTPAAVDMAVTATATPLQRNVAATAPLCHLTQGTDECVAATSVGRWKMVNALRQALADLASNNAEVVCVLHY